MAFSLANVRQMARGFYGLEWSTAEDSLYSDNLLNSLINKAHHWLAGVARPYFNDALSQVLTTNTASYALDPTVIEPDVRTFRLLIDAAYTRLKARQYHSLIEEQGPLEAVAAGTPTSVYIRAGTANAAVKKFELVPKPNSAAGTAHGTVYYGAWVYPAQLTSDSDTFPLADPDIYRLVAGVCWEIAQFDASRGRENAPLAMWAERSMREAIELQRIILHGTRDFNRTPEVGASPLDDVLDRRRPPVLYGGQG